MNRRLLFKTLGVAGLGGLFGLGISKALESPYGLGEYKSHSLTFKNIRYPDGLYEIPFLSYRYVNFPIEDILTIKYKNGTEVYTSFNMTSDLVYKINKMSPKELFSYRVKDGNKLMHGGSTTKTYVHDFLIDNYKILLNHVIENDN